MNEKMLTAFLAKPAVGSEVLAVPDSVPAAAWRATVVRADLALTVQPRGGG